MTASGTFNMRILHNSKSPAFKTPFGVLRAGEACRITLHIPKSCHTQKVQLRVLWESGEDYASFTMQKEGENESYEFFSASFSLAVPSLYFYFFSVTTENEHFSLYRQGEDQTNMEEGELWQLSCIPVDFTVPADFRGKVMYQIFPDRFYQEGHCDTTKKLRPFTLHENKADLPHYLPNEEGTITNSDFFGGNLKGITAKLSYLADLGVEVLYLNPIFKAYSNHRYDTADYKKIDELLGTEADFVTLCREAHKLGMKIILDGVFSHTGSRSLYFDRENEFGGGAYHNPDSPFFPWFDFQDYPHRYTAWWGIDTLPCVQETNPTYMDYIIDAEDSVIAHWLSLGADGFRLDVADELPDEFIARLRQRLKALCPDALLIGEVWEDASNKISYSKRRRYFTGGELDSVMNYPWRQSVLNYVCGQDRGTQLAQNINRLAEHYPAHVLQTVMNMLSTHDTPRLLSLLSPTAPPAEKRERAEYKMSEGDLAVAKERFFAATLLQFVLPGMPCIYYGDEVGMEGWEDPFCRGFFPWESPPVPEFHTHLKVLSTLRRQCNALREGRVYAESDDKGRLFLSRTSDTEQLLIVVNTGEAYSHPCRTAPLLSRHCTQEKDSLHIAPYGFAVLPLSR